MKSIEELLKNLARPEVLEFGLVTNRLPSVNVGGRFEPVDDEAPTTETLLRVLSSVGGSAHVETLGDKPIQWTTRIDGVGVIAVAAIMRKDVVQARFTVARREAASKPQPGAGTTQPSTGASPRELPAAVAPEAQPRPGADPQRSVLGGGPAVPSPLGPAKPAGPPARPSEQGGLPRPAFPPSSPSLKVAQPAPAAPAEPAAAGPSAARQAGSSGASSPEALVPPAPEWDDDDDDEPTVQKLVPPLGAAPGSAPSLATVEREDEGARPPPAQRSGDHAAEAPASGAPARAAVSSDLEITQHLRDSKKLSLELEKLQRDEGNTTERPLAPNVEVAAAASGSDVLAPRPPLPAALERTPPTVEPDAPLGGDASLDACLRMAVAARATDIHVVAGRPVLLRVAGELLARSPVVEPARVDRMVADVVPTAARARLERDGACDFAFEHPAHGRFRVNVSRQRSGYKLSMRVVPREPPTAASLGLADAVVQVGSYASGLVLVTGPRGHGKSSTVAALIEQIVASSARHVVTVEDPIEHLHASKRGIVTQREIGAHARSVPVALRAALREAPDVLSIGELRDAETVRLAFDACEAGCVVIATLAASGASTALDRIVDLFAAGEQPTARLRLAGCLRVLFGQRLVPGAEGNVLRLALGILPRSVELFAAIRDGRTSQIPLVQQRGKALGAVRLDEALADLVKHERVTLEVAKRFAEAPHELDALGALPASPALSVAALSAVRRP